MSRNTMNLYVRQSRSFFEDLQGFAFRDTHPAHAGVDLEIDRHLRAGRHAIEILGFLKGGDRRDETALCDYRSLLREGWTKNDDRMRKRCAQSGRFFQIRDAKQLRVLCERLRDSHHSMSVTIRFDDREKLGRPN